MAGWFNKEINSLEDIKGVRMRIPGLAGKVFTRAGGESLLLHNSLAILLGLFLMTELAADKIFLVER